MLSLLTNRRPKQALVIGFALAALVAVVLVGTVAASWWYEDNSTVSGTVDGTDWEGRVSVGWKAPEFEKPSYGGDAFTEADAVINEIYVNTQGSKWCGPHLQSTDWYKSGLVNDAWIVGRSGRSTFWSWECLWFLPHHNVIVRNEAFHRVWDGDESDSGDHRAVLRVNLNP